MWEPIETAPKDGTPILLYQCVDQFDLADPKGKMTDYYFSGFYNQRFKLWECWESDQYSHEPTHWMPLPKPPSAQS